MHGARAFTSDLQNRLFSAQFRTFPIPLVTESFERLLWNGEYYSFCYNPRRDGVDRGCMADQVSGQLFARLLVLGSVHEEEHVRSALRAVHRSNPKLEEDVRIHLSERIKLTSGRALHIYIRP